MRTSNMRKFKIAQMVLLNDMRRARVMREVSPRRWQVCVFGSGELLDVAQGDLALPGEDGDNEQREAYAEQQSGGVGRPGDPPPDAVGIDYSNASHRRQVAAYWKEKREREWQNGEGD